MGRGINRRKDTGLEKSASEGSVRYFADQRIWDEYEAEGPYRKELRDHILTSIPPDVESIVDLGCGNGIITNSIPLGISATALDRSLTALKIVQTHDKVLGDISSLPFKDKRFDLVMSSEVLEHLSDGVLEKSVTEMQRISKRYVLVTVPNNEYVKKNFVKCKVCKHEFNPSFHIQRFRENRLSREFSACQLLSVFRCGKRVRSYNPLLLWIKHRFANRWARFSWKRTIICPNCSNDDFPFQKHNLISFFCDALNALLNRKYPNWIGILFVKKNEYLYSLK